MPSSRTSVLGGQTPDGKDATNDLTHLILESTRALSITCPEPCIRIHANTPDSLLHHVAEVVKDGKGFPKLLNDEMIVPFYLANGASLKEALDWCISGCCESRLPNRETNVTGSWRHQLRFGRRNDLPQRETQGFQRRSVRSADGRSADLDEL